MLGFGIGEIILILVVAIIVLGPDKLPSAIIEVAKFFRVIKKTMQDARDTLDKEVNLSELKKQADEYKEKLENSIDISKDVKDATLIKDIKEDMNDIEHLFKDFTPREIKSVSDSTLDSKEAQNIESKKTDSKDFVENLDSKENLQITESTKQNTDTSPSDLSHESNDSKENTESNLTNNEAIKNDIITAKIKRL